jgi:hypothetical protein
MSKLILGLFALALTISVTSYAERSSGDSQGSTGGSQGTTGGSKDVRWEGRVVRMSKTDSTLTVRKAGGSIEKTCAYDSSTKWVSQYHADKKINDIDPNQVKEEDYVICKGTATNAGTIKATLISKRLSHSE